MPIQDLLELVETLRKRIDEHGAALRSSEALTRNALIDPWLRALNWNPDDPALVVPEYRSGKGRADYALMRAGSPLIMLEVKKLSESLDVALSQAIADCLENGTPYFCVSDGKRWALYETHRLGPIVQKMVVSWDLDDTNIGETCLKALALWRHSITPHLALAGETPVVGFESGEKESKRPEENPKKEVDASPYDWHPLTEVETEIGQKVLELQFPSGERVTTGIWRDVVREVVRWLSSKEILNANLCPIKSTQNAIYYLVNTEPKHASGPFGKYQGKVNGLHFVMGTQHHRNQHIAVAIIRGVGQDPSQFKVRIS